MDFILKRITPVAHGKQVSMKQDDQSKVIAGLLNQSIEAMKVA